MRSHGSCGESEHSAGRVHERADTYDEIADYYDDFVGGSEYRVPAWLIGEIENK